MSRDELAFRNFHPVRLLVAVLIVAGAQSSARADSGPEGQQSDASPAARVWPSTPPADIPFPRSMELTGIAFTGRFAHYGQADTWYPSWAANGRMYSSFADGEVNGISTGSWVDEDPKEDNTGYATIIGDDPLHLRITDAGTYKASGTPYPGRYPAGTLVYNGVWFYGTYSTSGPEGTQIPGPFVGFRWSTDYGLTWHPGPTPAKPLFGGVPGGKLGLPHFVDFGQNMKYSPDGKAYLVSQAAEANDPQPYTWITGDEIDLVRVKPIVGTINSRAAYEYFAGTDTRGHAKWTHDYARMQPLLAWNQHMGNVSVTYDAPLHKYLMAVTDGGKNEAGRYTTYILESPQVTGPWKLVTYMRDFGEQAYFVNFPSKFISRDGRTLWMSYSANWRPKNHKSDPPGSGYWWTLQEVRLLGPGSAGDGGIHGGQSR